MFASGLKESTGSEIKLDCGFDALEVIVRYIYTKEVRFEGVAIPSFELWSEIFLNARLMAIPDLARVALWFCYASVDPDHALDLLMCKEQAGPGVILIDVCDFMKTHFAS